MATSIICTCSFRRFSRTAGTRHGSTSETCSDISRWPGVALSRSLDRNTSGRSRRFPLISGCTCDLECRPTRRPGQRRRSCAIARCRRSRRAWDDWTPGCAGSAAFPGGWTSPRWPRRSGLAAGRRFHGTPASGSSTSLRYTTPIHRGTCIPPSRTCTPPTPTTQTYHRTCYIRLVVLSLHSFPTPSVIANFRRGYSKWWHKIQAGYWKFARSNM